MSEIAELQLCFWQRMAMIVSFQDEYGRCVSKGGYKSIPELNESDENAHRNSVQRSGFKALFKVMASTINHVSGSMALFGTKSANTHDVADIAANNYIGLTYDRLRQGLIFSVLHFLLFRVMIRVLLRIFMFLFAG